MSSTDYDNGGTPEVKRRKVRKGTRSCWECRRRKLKCIFMTAMDTRCINCQRRGTRCVGQEFPEDLSVPMVDKLEIGHRMGKVEDLLGQVLQKVSLEKEAETIQPPPPRPSNGQIPVENKIAAVRALQDDNTATLGFSPKLSQILHSALPSIEDTKKIAQARGDISTLFYEVITIPYNRLDQKNSQRPECLLQQPSSQTHPVLIARHMLYLATFLQHLHPRFHGDLKTLSEPPRMMMKRLAETAFSMVTTNDDLIGSIEGLECVLMESMYYANMGNLRKSMVAVRRAMLIAQMMDLHRPSRRIPIPVLDANTESHPEYLWFRIVSADRQLCLMLGLPQGTLDCSMSINDAIVSDDTPMGRLERMHCAIASRILERNQSDEETDDSAPELDWELQQAARSLPCTWWLPPNPAIVSDQPETLFWDIRRLFNQLYHYNLINQVHLPSMLRRQSEHARINCIHASREMLTRFLTFRSCNNIAFCCRPVDFFSFMAALTLLLAHLHGHRLADRREGDQSKHFVTPMSHQRQTDRAMMEQVQESMEEQSRLIEDALSAQWADLLRRLLVIEAEAADGRWNRAASVTVQMPTQSSESSAGAVSVHIPYFGLIRIAREMANDLPNMPDGARSQQESPLLSAELEDWALHGMDVAFWDNLIKSVGNNDSVFNEL
ncbi:putative transcription factor gsfR1 [Talaromyces pinophilus]|nr:putative transcription factor gsfR1 [Talaromyces pinophilus]